MSIKTMNIQINDINTCGGAFSALAEKWLNKILNLIDPEYGAIIRIIKHGSNVWVHTNNEGVDYNYGEIYYFHKSKGMWELIKKIHYDLDYYNSSSKEGTGGSPLNILIETDMEGEVDGRVRIECVKPIEGLEQRFNLSFLLSSKKTLKVYDYGRHSYTLI